MLKMQPFYTKYINKCNINWNTFSIERLIEAKSENKPILFTIGLPGNRLETEECYEVFSDESIAKIVNEEFIPFIMDIEECPYIYQIATNIISSIKADNNSSIIIYFTPDLEPIFSHTLSQIDYLYPALSTIAEICKSNNYNGFKSNGSNNQFNKIMLGCKSNINLPNNNVYNTTDDIDKEISEESIHTYINNWGKTSNFINKSAAEAEADTEEEIDETEETGLACNKYRILLEYYHKFNNSNELSNIIKTINSIYYTKMYDITDGGFFTQSLGKELNFPITEKSLRENSDAALLYAKLYERTKEIKHREISKSVVRFITTQLKNSPSSYSNLITIKKFLDTTSYFEASTEELIEYFPTNYSKIEEILNSAEYNKLTNEDIERLKKIRSKKDKESEIDIDTRIIVANNCHFANVLCEIAQIIPEVKEEYINTAEAIVEFIRENKPNDTGTIYRYITPDKTINNIGTSFDQAEYIKANINLYYATNNKEYLKEAVNHTEYIIDNLYNSRLGMFAKGEKKFTSNFKCEPQISITGFRNSCDNALIAESLILLHNLTGNTLYRDIYLKQIHSILPYVERSGPYMHCWVSTYLTLLSKE